MLRAGGTLPPPSHVTKRISAMAGSLLVDSSVRTSGTWVEEALHEVPHPALGAVTAEAAVAAEQLPGVDVGGHDEQVGQLLGVLRRVEERREHLLDPLPVHRLAARRDARHQVLVRLLG